jgi:hypothetical protein
VSLLLDAAPEFDNLQTDMVDDGPHVVPDRCRAIIPPGRMVSTDNGNGFVYPNYVSLVREGILLDIPS